MATNDSELINEVRGLTDYGTAIMTDGELQTLVDIGKEEIQAHVGELDSGGQIQFFGSDTLQQDRALFWFTCIAAKAKAGEIASVNLTVGSIRSTSYAGSKFDFYFKNFDKRMATVERVASGGPAQVNATRSDDRSYDETGF